MAEYRKIPVEIRPVKDPEGKIKIKATIPVSVIMGKSFNAELFEKDLKNIEERYSKLVEQLRELKNTLGTRKPKKGRVLLYWEIGNEIENFIKINNLDDLYITNAISSLSRDTGISERILARCKRFKATYPVAAKIEPSRSFDSYVAEFEKGYRNRNT